ncbi:SDR family oxidoreductase [Nitriliruptor alkaliphilus]|uniref:SDR family oxidoreductase n=1 Tax=Nitriliruptor alkaliphilus TaxID=427918 RepID=UPI0006991587|nr:SDR family oxidoreductase [Nitriliruptor alkaliphilus]
MTAGHFRNLFDLTGRVAVVTGGAGILGRRFAAALADHGAAVAVVDLDEGAVQEVANALRSEYGGRAEGFVCDVSDEVSVRDVVVAIEDGLGPIDVLHNNAASKSSSLEGFFAPLATTTLATWREVMAVNLDGMFLVAREVGNRMVARERGSIVQTASIYGVMAPDQRIYEGSSYLGMEISSPVVYSASKAGVVGLTRHLAAEWGLSGVRVNTLVPGGVRSGQNDTFLARYSQRVPLGRMAEADEMTGALIYLASDASSYVTGQTLMVDGGLSAW